MTKQAPPQDSDLRCLSTYRPIKRGSWCAKALDALFDGVEVSGRLEFSRADYPAIKQRQSAKMSISGYQNKLLLCVDGGMLRPVRDGEAATYILKPIPGQSLLLNADVPANEHLTMLIASSIYKLRVAANTLVRMQDGEWAYLTRRFDRLPTGAKLPQEDFQQLLGATESTERSYESIARWISRHCTTASIDLARFFEQLCFNALFANGDAHLKNFSIQTKEDGDISLTPAYDLLCTRVHIQEFSRLALDLYEDDDAEAESVLPHGWQSGTTYEAFAKHVGINQRKITSVMRKYRSQANATKARDLINNSYLSQPAKEEYTRIFLERLEALRV